MLFRNRALLSIAASSPRFMGVVNLKAATVTRSNVSFSSSFSTNAAEVFENESPAKNVVEQVPKKDVQSAILKENSIQEKEATHQQVQQLSEQMEDTFNKEKQFQEDNKIGGATAQQIWETGKVDVSKTSEDVLKDLSSEKGGDGSNPTMFNDIKDAAKGSLNDAKEKLKETMNAPSGEAEKAASSRRQGGKRGQDSKEAGTSDSDKPRSKQYSENKQNASIL